MAGNDSYPCSCFQDLPSDVSTDTTLEENDTIKETKENLLKDVKVLDLIKKKKINELQQLGEKYDEIRIATEVSLCL
jgi:hypothetical protein